jgi:hypothetical protein
MKFTLILMVANIMIGNCQSSYSAGSLVIAIPSQEGLVIVSDRKMTNVNPFANTTYGDERKIDTVNKFFGFTVTGRRREHGNVEGQNLAFNSPEIVKDFFKDKDQINLDPGTLEGLANKLMNSYFPILKSKANSLPKNSEKDLLAVLLYDYNVQLQEYQLRMIRILHTVGNRLIIRWEGSTYKELDFKSSKESSLGESFLVIELQNGKKKEFDELRATTNAKEFLIDVKQLYSAQKVIDFSKWIIRETSQRNDTVGKDVDAILITTIGIKSLGNE